jgi:lysophospholipase L1-like esterase
MNEFSQYQDLAKEYSIFNGGVGGDGIEHILYRLEKGFLSHIGNNLEKLILLAGTNNIEKYDEHKIYEGFFNLLRLIRDQRNVSVIIIGLPPRFSSSKKIDNEIIMQKVTKYNGLLSRISSNLFKYTNNVESIIPLQQSPSEYPINTNYQYYDITNSFLNNEGNIDKNLYIDHVHFNEFGYQVFIDELKQIIIDN